MKMLRVFAALLLLGGYAYAQGVGQLGSGQVYGNPTASRAPASPATVTSMLDRAFSDVQGAILYRGASAWAALAAGTAGQPLITGGAGANPSYAVLGLSGGGTNASLTASNGGIVYSTASALAILSGTATANQIILSGSSTAPAWSTATYPATAAAGDVLAASSADVIAGTPTPTLGVAGSVLGTISLAGNTSGAALITPQAAAGTPTLTLPNATGTFAVSATAPLAVNATSGDVSCATCATTTNGGALSGTSPVAIDADGVVSITGAAGQVLAGDSPAFTATPTLGANGGTGGQITLEGATSGSAVIRVPAAAGTGTIFQLPDNNGSSTNVLSTDGAGVLSWSAAGSGTVTSVAAGTGMSFTTITTTGSVAVDVASAANFMAGTSNKILDAANVFTGEVTTSYASPLAFDFDTFLHTKVTLTGDVTSMTCSNIKAGQAGVIRYIQDGSGGHTISGWCTEFKFSAGTLPTNTEDPDAIDVLSYFCSTTSFCTASLTTDVQ